MHRLLPALIALLIVTRAHAGDTRSPTWWAKYRYLLGHGTVAAAGPTPSLQAGANVNVSNECGPQSETYVAIDTRAPKRLAGGSNEIFRLPMRGYASADGGGTWSGVDLPLPPPIGTNGTVFGSDPTLVFDSRDTVYYGYIVVYFSNGSGLNGSAMAGARSTDGGRTYPTATFFSFESGSNHFNDKPMITADANRTSPYRDSVYVAWDAAAGGSTGGGVRLARSRDGGATFTTVRIDDPKGPGRAIGAVPFVGPNGEVYVAWNDYAANRIVFTRSVDGGVTWAPPRTIAGKAAAFEIAVPAEHERKALVYPTCDADRSSRPHRGRLSCAWTDLTPAGLADVVASESDDQGTTWSAPHAVTDALATPVDRFNPWLSTDAVTGDVDVSFYDTRNDTTGRRYDTDIYLARSSGGANIRVTTARSNEHDCGGVVPCSAIDYGNQQGDYSGLVSYDGVAHPIWTDSRRNQTPAPGCRTGLAMDEVFTATVK